MMTPQSVSAVSAMEGAMQGSHFIALLAAGLVAGLGLLNTTRPVQAKDCVKDQYGNCLPDDQNKSGVSGSAGQYYAPSTSPADISPKYPSASKSPYVPASKPYHLYMMPPQDLGVSPSPQTGSAIGTMVGRPLSILGTGYKALTKLGGEESGYGLYSYAIAPGRTERNAAFLRDILTVVAPVENTGPEKSKINILYIPVRPDKEKQFDDLKTTIFGKNVDGAKVDAASFYHQSMAINLLHRICASATGEVSELCRSDISQGPFLFTYAKPVTALNSVPPPYLIVDLRPVHERAFPVFISKFMEQVKSPDFADGKRIHSFKLRLLSIVLTAADWIEPVEKAVAGIVHSSGDKEKGGK